jgi:hypothetical protein
MLGIIAGSPTHDIVPIDKYLQAVCKDQRVVVSCGSLEYELMTKINTFKEEFTKASYSLFIRTNHTALLARLQFRVF